MQGAQGGGADLALSTAAFRDNESDTFAVQLTLDRLGHGQLGVIEGVAHLLLDVVVDRKHLSRQRFGCRVEQGCELVPNTVSHSNTEGVKVVGDVVHILKAVWPGQRRGW